MAFHLRPDVRTKAMWIPGEEQIKATSSAKVLRQGIPSMFLEYYTCLELELARGKVVEKVVRAATEVRPHRSFWSLLLFILLLLK